MLNRADWIAALRDPKNKQTRGVLMNEKREMCCLGVGLVAAGEPHEFDPTDRVYLFGDGMTMAMPDKEQCDLLGISGNLAEALATLNDDLNVTFAQIADFLETGDETPLLAPLLALYARHNYLSVGDRRQMAALTAYDPNQEHNQ